MRETLKTHDLEHPSSVISICLYVSGNFIKVSARDKQASNCSIVMISYYKPEPQNV